MISKVKLFFLGSLLCVSKSVVAQESIEPKWTFNTDISIPFEISNPFFHKAVDGVLNFQPYVQYSLPFHFHLGVGAKYQFFKINSVEIPSPRFGGFHTFGGFVNIGYDQFLTKRFALDISLKAGYGVNLYRYSVVQGQNIQSRMQGVPFIEPGLGLILTITGNLGVKWYFGYGFQNYALRPQDVGFESNEGYTEDELSGKSQYVQAGFGLVYYIGYKSGNEED